MEWEYCVEHYVDDADITKTKIKALLTNASRSAETAKDLNWSAVHAPTKIIALYDAIRETLEVIAYTRHLEIHNHACYQGFLESKIGAPDLAREFDVFRGLRNALEYGGKQLGDGEAKQAFKRLENLYRGVRGLLPKHLRSENS